MKNDDEEDENFETLFIDSEFHGELINRIKSIRKLVKLKKKSKHKKGVLFNDDSCVAESVLTVITDSVQAFHHGTIIKKDENEDILVSADALGLNFKKKSVKSGWYDTLIKSILKRLAELDYQRETDDNLN